MGVDRGGDPGGRRAAQLLPRVLRVPLVRHASRGSHRTIPPGPGQLPDQLGAGRDRRAGRGLAPFAYLGWTRARPRLADPVSGRGRLRHRAASRRLGEPALEPRLRPALRTAVAHPAPLHGPPPETRERRHVAQLTRSTNRPTPHHDDCQMPATKCHCRAAYFESGDDAWVRPGQYRDQAARGASRLVSGRVVAGSEWRSIKEMLAMTLHDRDSIRDQSEDCVFAARDMNRPIPKYRFPREETPAREAYQLVADELMMDGNARQNLATFCQTWEEPEVLELMALAINKNMIDRDEYPQSAEIERRCVHMMADLWNAPDAANTVGTSAIGSSEACMLAGMAAKWRWRARRRAAGKPIDNPNFVCGPVQVVWHKFARYWDVEIREVPMAPGRYMMDPESMLERVDENTIMVVPTLGVTYTGAYEQVEAMSQALDKLQADTGLDVDIHVDGASGGFLAPFCAPEVAFDFRLPRVKSISASGHKFGLAPLGAGWVVFRDAAELPEDLIFHVNYLGGDMPEFQINFSRPAGQIVASYYNFLRLGHEGYRRVHMASYEIGQYLAAEIVKLGPFELLCEANPNTEIPTVTWRIREGESPGYTLYDLADRLRTRGWQVPAYTLTGTASDISVQRILVRLGVSRDMASLLLDDFRDAVAHFGKHPVTVSMTKQESGGFSHL